MQLAMTTSGRHRRLADSDSDSSDSEDPSHGDTNQKKQSLILTSARASEHCAPGKAYRLLAAGVGYRRMDDLSALRQIDYIDLSRNKLSNLDGLSGLRRLKTLNVSNNRLSVTGLNEGITKLDTLRVLNVSANAVGSMFEWVMHAAFAPQLLTLIVTHARVATLDGVAALHALQTLVVSHNDIEDLAPVCALTQLKKLSASHNKVRSLPQRLPGTLTELRVAHNAITDLAGSFDSKMKHYTKDGVNNSNSINKKDSSVAGAMITWRRNLTILDIGHNRMSDLSILSAFDQLKNINVKGNPVCEKSENTNNGRKSDDEDDGADNHHGQHWIQCICPNVQVVDGMRVAGGRRKNRINRLRVAAGLKIEADRKFARAPHVHAVKRLMEQQQRDDGAPRQTLDEDAMAEGERVLRRAQQKEREEGKSCSDKGEGDDDVEDVEYEKKEKDSETKAKKWKKRKTEEVEGKEKDEDASRKRSAKRAKRQGQRKSSADKPSDNGNDGADEDDDDAIDAESFMQQARDKVLVKSMAGAKVKTLSAKDSKKKRKKQGRHDGDVGDVSVAISHEPFGRGGEAQW